MSKRTEQKMTRTQFEKFVTDGNEKADELAKAGAMSDEGFMSQTSDNGSAGTRRGARSLAVRSQPSQFGGGMERLKKSCRAAKRKVDLCGQEKRRNKASNGILCCGHISTEIANPSLVCLFLLLCTTHGDHDISCETLLLELVL